MGYRLEPYTQEWEPAVARLNSRLSAAAPFLLAEKADRNPSSPIQRRHHLVTDDSGEVRGGCLLQYHCAWVGGATVEAVNLQSPLSEGLADRRYVGVGPWMIREIVRRHPYTYSVGMGGGQTPYPRMTRSLGWRVDSVPFFFRVLAGRRFLANMRPLREHAKFGWVATAGAFVPFLPDMAFSLLHRGRKHGAAAVTEPAGTADWETVRARYGFAIERDPGTLDAFYPPEDVQFHRITVAGGFAILRFSSFTNHKYFGGMTVATLAEAVAAPGSLRSLLEKSVRDAKRSGADLLVTNQSAPEIVEALAAQGWISYESNYSATFSPALAAQIDGRPYYLTRGDGDGLVNL